ncbi:MAG: ATP-binding cassette domain-containing protein, partial [Anaerolineae bacterium]|nr:ATP-binding cassette domain-containing protein [Anaerolineae bacterium]
MSIALRAENVTKIYGDGPDTVKAVKDVSFEINSGEFVALVGPSGSGKTTMLAMLAGLLSPTDGRIFIDGKEMSAMGDRERANFRRQYIGFTFQQNNLVPYLTARDNVDLMLRLNKKPLRNG